MKWLVANKKGLILGFIFGALVAPLLSTLGLVSSFFEMLRPLLLGPMDLVKNIIPDIQTAPNTYYVPFYKWIFVLGFNGICYALVAGIIQSIIQAQKS